MSCFKIDKQTCIHVLSNLMIHSHRYVSISEKIISPLNMFNNRLLFFMPILQMELQVVFFWNMRQKQLEISQGTLFIVRKVDESQEYLRTLIIEDIHGEGLIWRSSFPCLALQFTVLLYTRNL